MVFGKGSGIVGLIAQVAVVCFWAYLGADGIWLRFTGSEGQKASVVGIAIAWALAAATAYCVFRQFKFVEEDGHFKTWLVANAEKIRNNHPVFYRGQRISPETELVRHHLVFSAIILSFRMQTRWIIKGKEPRLGHALAASLYTFCYGWWGFPFGIFWTPVALFKNLTGSTSVRVVQLLQPAPAKPVGFGQRFQKNFSSRLQGGFFIDGEPAGIMPADEVGKA